MPRKVHLDGSHSIDEFCEDERISRGTWYNLVRAIKAPEFYFVGSRVRISQEARTRWRTKRLAAAAADYAAASEKRRTAKLKADTQQAAANKAVSTAPNKGRGRTPKHEQP